MNEIFIFAQTRSGSTLLMRAINQTPDVTIYGEHGGLLHGYAAAYYAAMGAGLNDSRFKPEVLKDPKMFAPCLSCIDPGLFKKLTRNYIADVLNADDAPRWGFKEVRYGKDPNCKVFAMLAELFPNAKFVFLVRDPREQIQSVVSMEWEKFADALKYWMNTHYYFVQCAKSLPNRCRMIEYHNLRNVRKLFNWLELDNRRSNLFKEMPRTGATESKVHLTMPELQSIKDHGALDAFINNQWGIE